MYSLIPQGYAASGGEYVPEEIHDFIVNAAKEALMFNYHSDYNWRHNVRKAPELFPPVGILFVIGIIVAFQSPWRNRPIRKAPVSRWKLDIRALAAGNFTHWIKARPQGRCTLN